MEKTAFGYGWYLHVCLIGSHKHLARVVFQISSSTSWKVAGSIPNEVIEFFN
jgi:hypothetical protein